MSVHWCVSCCERMSKQRWQRCWTHFRWSTKRSGSASATRSIVRIRHRSRRCKMMVCYACERIMEQSCFALSVPGLYDYNAASVTGHAIMEKVQKNKQSVKKEKTTGMQLRAVSKILAAASMKGILGKCTRGLMGSHPNLLTRRKTKQAFAKRIGNRP